MGKRPGFRREKPLYLLRFEGEEFDGLEVTAKSLPLGEFFALQRLQEKANADPDAAEQIISRLADVITGWNLEDEEDVPVPCTLDGIKQQDMPFVLAIFQAWMEAVASIPNRSKGNSNDGGTSPEPSIPMEPS